MKKKIMMKAALCSLLAVTAACTANDPLTDGLQPGGNEIDENTVFMNVPPFRLADNATRGGYTEKNGDFIFNWGKDEVVGIYAGDNRIQAPFTINPGKDLSQKGSTAVFNGGVWALKPNQTYYAYYPFRDDATLRKNMVTLSYTGQVQKVNNNTDHLTAFDYLSATAATGNQEDMSKEGVTFDFQHTGCMVKFACTGLPKPCTYSQLMLSSAQPIFVTDGTLNLTDGKFTPNAQRVKTLTYHPTFTANWTTGATFFLMMAPTDLSGNEITLTLTGKKNNKGPVLKFTGTFQGVDLQSGNVNIFKLAMNQQ